MDILSDVSTLVNGGISLFNAYILFRVKNLEKDAVRERKSRDSFQQSEQRTNVQLDNRLRKIEMEMSKRFSTFNL